MCAGDRGVYPLRGRPLQRYGETSKPDRGADFGKQSVERRLRPVERLTGCREQSAHSGGGQQEPYSILSGSVCN